jgi:hypothetical protein
MGFIFLSDKVLPVGFQSVHKTRANEKNKLECDEKKLKLLLFFECHQPISFDFRGNILPCCGFHVLNSPRFYKIGHIGKKITANRQNNQFFEGLKQNRLSFLRMYLTISKSEKIRKIFQRTKFYSLCDLCMLLWKYRDIIQNNKPISNFEMFLFILYNFPYFILVRFYKNLVMVQNILKTM